MARKRFTKALYYLAAVLISAVMVIPFLWMVSTSFKSRGALMALPIEWIPQEPSFDAYIKVFTRFPFARAIGNSLLIATAYTALTILSSSMAAFAFAKIRFSFANGLFKVYLASMMIPVQVTLIPLFVIMNKLGWINTYASVITPSLFKVFAIFLLVQTIRSIPNDYLDAARIDGAGTFTTYFRIVMPLCTPTIATLCITTFMDSWNDYLWPLVMLTDKDHMTLPIALSTLNGQYTTEFNVLMAGSLISMIPIIIIYLIAQRSLKGGISMSGIKG